MLRRRLCRKKSAHPLHRIPSPKPFDLPLLIVRYVSRRWQVPTYEPPSLAEITGGTTTQFPRVELDIDVILGVKALDLVDPWLQFPIFKYGREVRIHGR